MDTGRQYYRFAYGDVHGVAHKIGYDQHVDVVARKRLAQDCLADLIFVLKGANFVDEVTLVAIGEWVAVSKENCVVFIYKRHAGKFSKYGRHLRLKIISKESA